MSRPRKILVADDSEQDVILIQNHLLRQGYAVITAKNGNEALAQVQAQNPDLVIMDLMMPEISGWKACEKMKEDPRYQHIPVLLCSALIQDDGKFSQYEVGDGYFPKPIDFDHLSSMIQKFLNKKV